MNRGKTSKKTRRSPVKHYVGLDVSMKETFVCIEDEVGKIIHQGKVHTDPELIAIYIKKFQISIEKVGIESGSISHWLVDELKKKNIPAICIDSRKMAAVLSVQINKTDKNDARGIAQAMRCGLYREVTQKSQYAIEVGTLIGCRKLLVAQKVQTTNAIRGFLKTFGIRLEATSDGNFIKKVRDKLSKNLAATHIMATKSIETLLCSLETIYEKLKNLTKQVEELAQSNDAAQRLMGIPGIGAITVMNYMAEIDDPKRFKKSRAVGAYLGMTPRQYSSGESVYQGRVSKCGSSEMRCLLVEAATVLLTRSKKWSKLKAWGLKIQRKHGFKKASMAVGRKLAVIMHKMWIDEASFIYGEDGKKEETAQEKIKELVCLELAV